MTDEEPKRDLDADAIRAIKDMLNCAKDPEDVAQKMFESMDDISVGIMKLKGAALAARELMGSVIAHISQNTLDVMTAATQCLIRDVYGTYGFDENDKTWLAYNMAGQMNEIARNIARTVINDVLGEVLANRKPTDDVAVMNSKLFLENAVAEKKWGLN